MVSFRSSLFALGSFCIGLGVPVSAQAVKLVDLTNADVQEASITADGRFAVYWIHEISGHRSLWSIPLDAPRVPVLQAEDFVFHRLSPRGHDLFYLVDDRVWRSSADGLQPPVPLSPVLPAGRDVISFLLSPDGERLVYLADQEVDQDFSLFIVPVDGSAPAMELDGSLALKPWSSTNTHFVFSPDGSWIAFAVWRGGGELYDLYSVPSDGSGPPLLLHGLSGPRSINPTDLQISTTGWVVYDAPTNGFYLPHAVPVDGSGSPLLLGGPYQGQADMAVLATRITPDGTRVVYVADQQTQGKYELYSAPIDGSGPGVKLSGAMVSQGDVSNSPYARTHELSPDGTRVIFRADKEADEVYELFSASIDGGGEPVRLNAPLPADSDVQPGFRVGAGRVVWRADQERYGVYELYSTPFEGGEAPLRLNPSYDAFEFRDVLAFELGRDGRDALYLANQQDVVGLELWGVPITGGTARRLSPPASDGIGTPQIPAYSRLGSRVLFIANLDGLSDDELYLADTAPRRHSADSPSRNADGIAGD